LRCCQFGPVTFSNSRCSSSCPTKNTCCICTVAIRHRSSCLRPNPTHFHTWTFQQHMGSEDFTITLADTTAGSSQTKRLPSCKAYEIRGTALPQEARRGEALRLEAAELESLELELSNALRRTTNCQQPSPPPFRFVSIVPRLLPNLSSSSSTTWAQLRTTACCAHFADIAVSLIAHCRHSSEEEQPVVAAGEGVRARTNEEKHSDLWGLRMRMPERVFPPHSVYLGPGGPSSSCTLLWRIFFRRPSCCDTTAHAHTCSVLIIRGAQ
jgi:hypothetical protein